MSPSLLHGSWEVLFSKDFWVTHRFAFTQPKVTLTNLFIEGITENGERRTYHTFENLKLINTPQFTNQYIHIQDIDANYDGITDTIQLQLKASDDLVALYLLISFDYEIDVNPPNSLFSKANPKKLP